MYCIGNFICFLLLHFFINRIHVILSLSATIISFSLLWYNIRKISQKCTVSVWKVHLPRQKDYPKYSCIKDFFNNSSLSRLCWIATFDLSVCSTNAANCSCNSIDGIRIRKFFNQPVFKLI